MKVSIITVSYNSSKTIKDTIQSVINQSYKNIEYIIVDGDSSDNTVEIVKDYEQFFLKDSKKKFKWISEKDKGIYDGINKGIKMATGDIIGILNSDDFLFDKNVISDVVHKFKTSSIDCLYGNIVFIDPVSNKIVRRWISKKFEQGLFEKSWTPAHPSFYCKKVCYDMHGLYKTNYKIAADVDLMYRFIDRNKLRSLYYARYMVTMRQGGVSSSGIKSTIIITREMSRSIKENGGKFNLIKYLLYKLLKVKEFVAR